MEHRTHALILGVILAIVVIGVVIISNFQFVTEPGGYFRIAQRSAPASGECYDTDGGANQFVRGSISYQDWSFVDGCSVTQTDSGELVILYEGYCADAARPVVVQYDCAKGCENGACIR